MWYRVLEKSWRNVSPVLLILTNCRIDLVITITQLQRVIVENEAPIILQNKFTFGETNSIKTIVFEQCSARIESNKQ